MAKLPIKNICFLSTQTQLEIVPRFLKKYPDVSCLQMLKRQPKLQPGAWKPSHLLHHHYPLNIVTLINTGDTAVLLY